MLDRKRGRRLAVSQPLSSAGKEGYTIAENTLNPNFQNTRNFEDYKPTKALKVIRGNINQELRKDGLHLEDSTPTNNERAFGMRIIKLSFEYYVDRLGFSKTGSREVRITNSTKIWMHPLGNAEDKPNDVSMHWFEIGTIDIEGFNQKLKEENVPVSDRYDNPGCGRYFDVYDPDGRKITVSQDWYDRIEE
ncbi:VOC family protein [Paenibacillus oceani]|uniref:VOC family protein n=1 Tax=Paenibacillus oceani TaxID=2772510 RepID=A0A927CF83_9BACL|nr:VOC family protein [Paenibacillus oceani]MBD2865116.1 VOC family protein [Paenibacillus oceani]